MTLITFDRQSEWSSNARRRRIRDVAAGPQFVTALTGVGEIVCRSAAGLIAELRPTSVRAAASGLADLATTRTSQQANTRSALFSNIDGKRRRVARHDCIAPYTSPASVGTVSLVTTVATPCVCLREHVSYWHVADGNTHFNDASVCL